MTEFEPKPQAMVPARVGNVIDELVGSVGRGVQRPTVIASQAVKRVDADLREAKKRGIRDSGVDAIAGERIHRVILGVELLPIAIKAEAGLVHPA